jgi:RimK family alpha-L-glutamate ligase
MTFLGERNRVADRGDRIIAIVGWPQLTNERLARAWQNIGLAAAVLGPYEVRCLLRAGDVAVGRFDVLETLDGIQPGIEVLDALMDGGVRVLNDRAALERAHDKLRTARLLESAGVRHPTTSVITSVRQGEELEPPVVIKPRFGSWGIDVFRCETESDLIRTLGVIATRPWFARSGALVQELVAPLGYDLRVVVAGGRVVGATERVARTGEWRTNVSQGGARRPARPSREAKALAIAAAAAISADLVGVDLLPVGDGHVVLELNGAAEFDRAYDLDGVNALTATALALGLAAAAPAGEPRERERTAAVRRSRAPDLLREP